MSSVSRSVYQKVCEENKRLKADIEVLTSGKFDNEYITTLLKYRKIFRKESYFKELMKAAAMQYLKDHPEIKIPPMPDACDAISKQIENMDDISKHQDKTY